jgi:AbrB family looped-hinge helix DNA binding protein
MEKELPVIVILGPKGRVVVPKSIRELIGADEGDALQLGVRKLNILE